MAKKTKTREIYENAYKQIAHLWLGDRQETWDVHGMANLVHGLTKDPKYKHMSKQNVTWAVMSAYYAQLGGMDMHEGHEKSQRGLFLMAVYLGGVRSVIFKDRLKS